MTNLLKFTSLQTKVFNVNFIQKCQIGKIAHGTFHTTKWRRDNKLPYNPTSFGPLTNLPDYSFKDGRVVPFGCNQKKRIDEQRNNLIKIKQLVGEIDMAVERHKLRLEQAAMMNQRIIDGKLKEKGQKLLISSKDDK